MYLKRKEKLRVSTIIPLYSFGVSRTYRGWTMRDLNPRHSQCKCDALPAELIVLLASLNDSRPEHFVQHVEAIKMQIYCQLLLLVAF